MVTVSNGSTINIVPRPTLLTIRFTSGYLKHSSLVKQGFNQSEQCLLGKILTKTSFNTEDFEESRYLDLIWLPMLCWVILGCTKMMRCHQYNHKCFKYTLWSRHHIGWQEPVSSSWNLLRGRRVLFNSQPKINQDKEPEITGVHQSQNSFKWLHQTEWPRWNANQKNKDKSAK